MSKNWRLEWWIEWSSTILLLIGVALSSYNIYPLNVWISLIGNFGWIIIGYMWKKMSLIVVSVIISLTYVTGLMYHYIIH